ncbi:hypothetical protein [Paraburkholderia aspalathi]|uniref:hypothetical protein n=1 Tax=Paraburkholderia aspalathi TaxID=1324617 RepID=UPI0038B6C6E9
MEADRLHGGLDAAERRDTQVQRLTEPNRFFSFRHWYPESNAKARSATRGRISRYGLNELAADSGAAPVSIHENHLKGDGKVYEDRKIPRISNERDYDYYHTLGVSFAKNSRIMPHYHLEFGGALNKKGVAAVLQSLPRIGQEMLGGEILSQSDIAKVLDNLPEGQPIPGLDLQKIAEPRQRLPNQTDGPEDRARSRDELESASSLCQAPTRKQHRETPSCAMRT